MIKPQIEVLIWRLPDVFLCFGGNNKAALCAVPKSRGEGGVGKSGQRHRFVVGLSRTYRAAPCT